LRPSTEVVDSETQTPMAPSTSSTSEPIPSKTPLTDARLTDRERLAVLLAGARLLAELEAAGQHLAGGAGGWEGAALGEDGRLVGLEVAEGTDRVLPQERLRDLVGHLFGSAERVAGRGAARRIVRRLLERWRQSLAPVPARRLVREILAEAPFLSAEGGVEPEEPADSLGAARRLVVRGRFRDAVEVLDRLSDEPEAEALGLRCRLLLGELGAVVHRLHGLAETPLPPGVVVDLADAAVRAGGNLHRPELVRLWLDRARAETGLDDRPAGSPGAGKLAAEAARAAVVTAEAAWDRGDQEGVRRALEEAAAVVDLEACPRVAWRWHQARGLEAMAAGDGEAMVEALSRALTADRRALCRHEAGGLWSDLGVGRARTGDLAGAERAFLHAQRLLGGCDGQRQTTLALYNLAEIRLRRGRTLGVVEILRRSTDDNRLNKNVRGLIHDLALWARFELVQGRPEAALEHVDEALDLADRRELDWFRAELRLLEARALGRLRREEEARQALEEVSAEALAELEPEERPGLFALAGWPERALEEAAGTPFELFWRAVLEGLPSPPTLRWAVLEELEPGRFARVVLDLETVRAGTVPPAERRRAVSTFRRLGATLYADALERVDAGPWLALGAYQGAARGGEAGDPARVRRLLDEAGYPEARLERWREAEPTPEVVVGGAGGSEEIVAELDGGRLVLRARQVDAVLKALFSVVLRDLDGTAGVAQWQRSPGRSGWSGRPARRGARPEIVGESPGLLAAIERIERLATGDLPIFVLGESGTGKELAARHLHRSSPRRERPFVAVNCAALNENLLLSDLFGHVRGAFTGADRDRAGVFESAEGGTVFLDEIGDLPASAQGMLLRVLQEGEVRRVGESLPRKVDARVVTATHRDLRAMVAGGEFREDLYYRLCVGVVDLPPLRDRGRDAVLLAEHILASLDAGAAEGTGGPRRLTAAARSRLLAHRWPGNVRELENVIRLAATLAGAGPIDVVHLELPEAPGGERGRGARVGDYHGRVEAFRRRLIEEALAASGGNKSEAARRLGLSRQALSYLTKELRIV